MKRLAHAPYLGVLLLILTVKAVLMLWLILAGPIGLSPDEAQYWTWSQHLDYNYYSKPAAIAWEIALGTFAFGNNELGVRIGAVLLALILPLAVYMLGRACELRPKGAFLAALTLVLTPLGILASILSITDTGMILFWTFACTVAASAISKEKRPNYYLIGLWIALGALFKWPIYLFWCLMIGSLPYHKKFQSYHIIGGIAVSLLGLLPTVIWNAENGWVSFLHVFHGVGGSDLAPKVGWGAFQGNFFAFWGAQIALVSPLVFLLLIAALAAFLKERNSTPPAVSFSALVTLFFLTFFGFFSLFKKVQGNWCDFVYPTAFVLLGFRASERYRWYRYLMVSLAVSTLTTFFVLAIPTIQSRSLFPSMPIPYKASPFKHNVGWDAIEKGLALAGYNPENAFLFSSSYQTTSILSFYGPKQKAAYFFNLHAIRQNQFSLWPGMEEEQTGKNGFFVVIENAPHLEEKEADAERLKEELLPHFSSVTYLGSFPLFTSYGKSVKAMLIFKCDEYKGTSPKKPSRY